jgi:4-diphosphocytidyl-2C-methyl-D-erythritol kinase
VDVYKSLAAQWKQEPAVDTVRDIPVSDTTDAFSRGGYRNDLQAAAERVRPELRDLRRRVTELVQREVAMTGSGSTLFVPCDDAETARRCAALLAPLGQEGVRMLTTRSAGDPGLDVPRLLDGVRGGGAGR